MLCVGVRPAANVAAAAGDAGFGGIAGTAVVKVFDLEVARTGPTLQDAREAGLRAHTTDVVHRTRARYYPGGAPLSVRLVHGDGGRLLRAQLVGRQGTAKRVDVVAAAMYAGQTVAVVAHLDLAYAPPYSPVYDPLLIAARAAQRAPEAA